MNSFNIAFLLPFLAVASCRIYSVENADGSYSIGLRSGSQGETADSLAALLTKSSGYTLDNYETQPLEETQSSEVTPQTKSDMSEDFFTVDSRDLLSPHMEILQLVETFLRFKGELASRLYALVNDNYDIIRSVYMTVISKIGTLHTFTLTGIAILRKVLTIANSLMAQWQITLPNVNLDLSVGNQGSPGYGAISINKNGNLFGRK